MFVYWICICHWKTPLFLWVTPWILCLKICAHVAVYHTLELCYFLSNLNLIFIFLHQQKNYYWYFCFRYTYQHAFKKLLQETDDFAGQREVISEEVHNQILKEMQKLSSESKLERRKVSTACLFVSNIFKFRAKLKNFEQCIIIEPCELLSQYCHILSCILYKKDWVFLLAI